MAVTAASSRTGREYDTRVQRAVLASTRVLSALIVVLGVTMVVLSLIRGGGPLALGVVLGTMLAAIGALRLWLARGAGSDRLPDGGER
jgi:hypothetical protein